MDIIDPALSEKGRLFSIKITSRAILICALLLCVAPSTVVAQYRFDVLNTNDGLPQNTVRAILQTRDGYLWFTTFDGLVRYNGARFQVFNKANTKGINSNRFTSLYEDTDGTLWIGTEDGGLTRYSAGRFKTYTTEDGLPHTYVGVMRRAEDGEFLVSTPAGLARMRGERFEFVSSNDFRFAPDTGIDGLAGKVWYRSGMKLHCLRDGRETSYTIPVGPRGDVRIDQLHEDRLGRLWIAVFANPNHELWMLKDEVMTRYSVRDGLSVARIASICEDREGTIWFGAFDGGLVRFKDGKFTSYTTAEGLSSNSIGPIFEDREGTLWIGTEDSGIMRMTKQVVTTISEKDGLKGKIFYPIIEDREGSIWVGYQGVNRFKDGKFTYYPLNLAPQYARDRQSQAIVQSFYEDREGALWIGHGYGLYRFEDDKFIYDQSMTTRGWPLAIFQDSQGAFWFGFAEWLTRYHNGEVRNFTAEDGLRDFVQPVYEDRQGRIWIGSYGGLAQYVDGRLVFLTEKDGLSSNRIRAIYEDADGVLWIGTYDGGLNRFKDG
jgi:ligand-binding sensor domain-containing protein